MAIFKFNLSLLTSSSQKLKKVIISSDIKSLFENCKKTKAHFLTFFLWSSRGYSSVHCHFDHLV